MTTRSGPEPRWLLAGLLLVGLALRLQGLDWGLPGEAHLYSYHPDEWQMVEGAVGLAVRGEANPRFFNYPSLTIYCVWLLTIPLRLAGLGLPAHYLAARLFGVVCSILTIAAVAALGRTLSGWRVGLIAAGLVAVAPLAVVNARFATVDGPLTLALTVAVWCACTAAAGGPTSLRWLAGAAVATGLAGGCKYNGLLGLVSVWAAAGVAPLPRRGRVVVATTALALGVFLLTSPYLLLAWGEAWPAIRYELLEHPRQSNLFAGVGPGWWFHLTRNAPTATGGLWLVAAFLGLAGLVRERRAWPVVVVLLVWGASLLRTQELFIRYWLPLVPLLALSAGGWLARWRARPWVTALAIAAVATGPALRSRATAAMLARPDARDEALAWCQSRIPPGATVGLDGPAWFWSVPLTANNGGARTAALGSESPWQLQTDPATWADTPPDWLVINRTHWDESGPATMPVSGYEPAAQFENRAVAWPGWVETGENSRRHDWNYIFPQIAIYQRLSQPKSESGSVSPASTAR